MAKISPVSIKYMIHAKFDAAGPVEKPDVIGALFGQTEGLLGDALEIRELQKEGKIGRIEVEVEANNGKSKGNIEIPTALDKSETSLIAAAIETIDRVGPTEAKITIEGIEDVRGNKRDYILERAKKLLEGMDSGSSREISENLKTSTRAARIQEYGDEKLPSGEISGDEVIVVEGRADVVNLLENRVNNVIGMNGTKLPKTIAELGKEKTLTLFADGDRGGKLIAKNVIDNANIGFVAFAPEGKEVEELTGKEILASLRKKVPVKEFSPSSFSQKVKEVKKEVENIEEEEIKIKKVDKVEFRAKLVDVEGTKQAYFYDKDLEVVKKVAAGAASKTLKRLHDICAVAVDGKATGSLIKSCEEQDVDFLAAKTFTEGSAKGVELVSF